MIFHLQITETMQTVLCCYQLLIIFNYRKDSGNIKLPLLCIINST